MIATPSPSRATYSIPDVASLRNKLVGRPWQFYEEGRRHLQERPKKTEEDYRKARGLVIKKEDRKAAASFVNLMGVDLDKYGFHKEALTFFDSSLELDPKYAGAWYNKGIVLGNLGRYEEALSCYDRALEIDPRGADAWNNKGAALDILGKREEAITCYDRALEIDPRDEVAWYNKGLVLYNLGRHEKAISCYDKALEINPKDAWAWNNKGLALYKLGRYEEAVEKYQKALELNKDLPEAHINLAVFLSIANRHDEAEKEFKESLRLFKEKKPLRLEEAVEYLDKELKAHPDSYPLWRAKGEFLKARGREAEAKKSIERAEVYEAEKYFEAHKEELLRKYEGKFVAILHDEVIDSDEDFESLEERTIKKFGARDLFVDKVTRTPEVIHIPTPFLAE